MLVRDMPACAGCPAYQDGSQQFWADQPGSTSEWWLTQLGVDHTQQYKLSGVRSGEVGIANVLRCAWEGKNQLPPAAVLTKALKHCRVHKQIPQDALVVAVGQVALRTLGSKLKISKARGWIYPPQEG